MLIVGLTGGIGSGKSSVSQYFESLGVPVIDTDLIARELVQPGKPALLEITRRFGDNILLADGSLNREMLRAKIFSSEHDKQQLENILHPRIHERVKQLLATLNEPYCIVVIPLLAESLQKSPGNYCFLDRILVVSAPEQSRLEFIQKRDNSPPGLIRKMMANQAADSDRQALADDEIKNTGDLKSLEEKVKALHQRYLQLSRQL